MPEFQIAGRTIGKSHPALIIAEVGINHNGSLDVAKQMVDSVHDIGGEIIKHQTHVVSDEMTPEAKKIIPGNCDVSIYEVMEQCALSYDDELELKEYVESKGLIFISTPFSRAAADRLREFDIPAYKIGSGECNNYPLIRHIASFGKPIILSTGMNDIPSIKKAVEIIEAAKVPYALLHCTNLYPTPHKLVRLGAMTEMMKEFPNAEIGLSDHTIDNYTCLAAMGMGASIIEKHYTDTRDREGPDIEASMDQNLMFDLLRGSRAIHQASGGKKGPLSEEQGTIDFAYATVVSIKPIKEGDLFSMDNIWVKRPGTGEIKAEFFEDILGKRASKSIPIDKHIEFSDIIEE